MASNSKRNKRQRIYDKYEGHCAYCGREITIDKMQVDHLVPLFRNHSDFELKTMGITRGTNDESNLMPSCPSCNHYKSTFTMETFRQELQKQTERLERDSANYRLAKRYGLVKETDKKIEFYYESN